MQQTMSKSKADGLFWQLFWQLSNQTTIRLESEAVGHTQAAASDLFDHLVGAGEQRERPPRCPEWVVPGIRACCVV